MKYTILVVDDDEAMLLLLKRIFEKKYNVFTASDGVEAISYLSEGIIPNIIISDLVMANITGYELIKHLSTSSVFNKIPILILSAIPENDVKISKILPVINRLISKPFDPVLLSDFVDETISKSSTPKTICHN